MPSNLELKRSLEQARKELSNKNKEIDQLNAKLSTFLELKESININETDSINTENKSQESQESQELQELQDSKHVQESPDSKPIKKRKKSLWYLYLW